MVQYVFFVSYISSSALSERRTVHLTFNFNWKFEFYFSKALAIFTQDRYNTSRTPNDEMH